MVCNNICGESGENGVLIINKLFLCCRKKLKSTSKYIFETLFVNGEGSDIKLVALGKVWPLHKVYLCQVLHLLILIEQD